MKNGGRVFESRELNEDLRRQKKRKKNDLKYIY